MDVRLVIKQRLEQLGLEQRDLAEAAQVTESYISQLLTRKKAPPTPNRTDLYDRMDIFLKLPRGKLSEMAEAQRREELKHKLGDAPAPLFKDVRELIIRKCDPERRGQVRGIFEKQAFGDVERLVTQKLLDVTKRLAKDELRNESWLRIFAESLNRPYEELRASILEFLDRDVLDVSPSDCSAFLDPLIDSWNIDLRTFGMEIVLNQRLASTQLMKIQFVEMESDGSEEEELGFRDFLRNPAMSGDITEEEIEFLRSLRFKRNRPSALYYYRELQSLRDPLHFRESSVAPMQKRREAGEMEKQLQLDSRKSAIQRWARNRISKKDHKRPAISRRQRGRRDRN